MKNKYNLALVPMSKPSEFIDVAQKLLSISGNYLLGKNSLPHVTLCQFDADDSEIAAIWTKVCDMWHGKSIDIELAEFSYITFDNDTYWISLLPKNSETLHKMHISAAEILKLPAKKTYDPHLTLLNTKNNHCQSEIENIEKYFVSIKDTFKLSLGRSDEVGQFTEIIY